MPQQTRASWAQLRVGALAIVGLAILGYLVFLLSGTHGLFKGKSIIYTYMGDSSDLSDGAPVRLNGIIVGKVNSVRLSGVSDPRRVIKIEMEIEDTYMASIPVDSQAKISAGNLLGTKFINISRGRGQQPVNAGAELKSGDTAELEDLFQQGGTTLAALQETIKKIDGIIDAVQVGNGTIGKLLVDETLYRRVLSIADEAQKLIATLNSDKGTLPKLLNDDKLYDDVRGTVTRINTLMDGLEKGEGTAGKLLKDPALFDETRATIVDIRKTIGQANQMLADVNEGKGTVGKLLKSDDLHDQLKSSIARLDTLLDKVNSGQGTLGQLLVNPALYESLDGTTRELHALLKDFRANPKKFLRIKIGLF
jgi:phospholipid/cholesterol/gamma-HCH transport system substrate-binding protein